MVELRAVDGHTYPPPCGQPPAAPHQPHTSTSPPTSSSLAAFPLQVRFDSPPAALASKPFQNEEVQTVTEMVPGQLYVVEAVSSTSAPYGDKFNVFFRYTVRAEGGGGSGGSTNSGSGSSTLHLVFHVEFLPAMNRMMRPMVAKAVDCESGYRYLAYYGCWGLGDETGQRWG